MIDAQSINPPSRFYRILVGERPRIDDFRSNAALGMEPKRPLTPEQVPLWEGLSVFDDRMATRDHASRSPWLGQFAAELYLPGLAADEARRTTRTPGHWTLWVPAERLLASVVAIIRTT